MNLKELTPKDALKKLYEEGVFDAYVWNNDIDGYKKRIIEAVGITSDNITHPFYTCPSWWKHCSIEVPEEYEAYPDNVCPPLKCGDVIICKESGIECLVTNVDKILPQTSNDHIRITDSTLGLIWRNNKELFELFTFPDGSHIGRKKE